MASQLDRSTATRVGEVREVTVFFSDIVGFTTMAEALPPYDVMYLLNRYFVQAGGSSSATAATSTNSSVTE